MEFRRALLRVAGEIGQKDLDKLKFACSDQIPDAKRERIHNATQLFVALEEKGLLSSDNLDYLARQLRDIGRPTLVGYFHQMGFLVSDASHNKTSNEDSPPGTASIEERLNKMLLFVSDKLTCSEIDRLAFAWCRGFINKTPDQIHSAYQLFTLMTQRMAISADNLDVLYIELCEMGRQDLCRSIEEYYAKNGIKNPLYPYHHSPPAPSSHPGTPSGISSPNLYNNGHYGEYSGFPSESPPSSQSSTRRSDESSDNRRKVNSSVDNPVPLPIRQCYDPNTELAHEQRFQLPEGNSALVIELYKKQQEVGGLKERLELEQNQRRLESRNNSSLVDQHQNQILLLQEALGQKNIEIQEIYKEFMDQNITSLQQLSLSQPLPEAEYYPMTCHPHGYCVIFNNHEFYQVEESHEQLVNRGGAEVDQKTLTDTFKFLQYNVEVYENLSSHDIVARMKEISSRNHSNFDSFICCILTHGEEGKIFGSDSLPVNLQDLTGLMKGTYCTSLVNKPKLFFVQACRGEKEDKGIPIERDGNTSLPVEADYLFGYATPTGKAAYRSRRHGSWFISELCNVFNNYAHVMGLNSMMKKVNRSVSEAYTKEGYKQCTEVVDRLRREVKFLPSYPQNLTQNIL